MENVTPAKSISNVRPNPIFRVMPSLTDVAFLMPVVFLFTRMEGIKSMLGDGDTGWHVRTGEWILAHRQVPYEDIFSFTMPGKPWFAWEWLWDVGAAWLHQHWGLGGVALASLFLICLTFALLFRVVLRECTNPLVAIGLTILATAGSTIHWLARPHLVTMLFTVIFLAILQRVREGRIKLLWWLPALTVLWTNLHGGFLVGITILGAYGAGELLRAALAAAPEERRSAVRSAIPYWLTAIGCMAASLINPYFYHLHQHIAQYLRDPYQMKYIGEFQSSNFQENGAVFLEAMLVLGLGAAVWSALRKRFSDAVLLACWAHLSLISARNIPLFMIVAAPVTAVAVVEWLTSLRQAISVRWLPWLAQQMEDIAEEIKPVDQLWRVHALSAVPLVLIGLAMNSPAAGHKLKPEYDPKTYPAKALAKLDSSQRIFTHDEWGDYLIYHLSPTGTKVFVDGRSDFYGSKFNQDYIDVMGVKYDWKETLDRYGVDTILLPPDAPLAGAIKESSRWRVVYDDGISIVFRSSTAASPAGDGASLDGIRRSKARVETPGLAANKLPPASSVGEYVTKGSRTTRDPQKITLTKKNL